MQHPYSLVRVGAMAATLLALVLLGIGASPMSARAASLGAVTMSQTSGNINDTPMFTSATTAACPTGYGENAALRVGRPTGPYSNLAPALGGGGYDQAPITINPNRSFKTALGGVAPQDGEWWVIMECYSLTEGRNADEFRTVIEVCGEVWYVGKCAHGVATRTTLTVDPTWSVEAGKPVTLTATVDPPAAVGSVTFRRATPAGSSSAEVTDLRTVTVVAGRAEITIDDLPANQPGEWHLLSAAFAPTDASAYVPSASAGQRLNVREAGTPTPTEVALTVDKPSGQRVGTPLLLTATVTPADVAGTVTFEATSAAAGSTPQKLADVAVSAGKATLTTSDLPAGDWRLSATLAPSDSGYRASRPVVVPFVVGAGSTATPTKTTLEVSPASPQPRGRAVTLTARVTPAGAAGTVAFLDGTTQVGTGPLAAGTVTATVTLPVGDHTLKAVFTSTKPEFAGSESAPKPFRVQAANGGDGDGGAGSGGALPRTGDPVARIVVTGLGLLALGLGAVLATRRRVAVAPVTWPDGPATNG